MKGARELFTNVNYILRLVEAVMHLLAIIFFHGVVNAFGTVAIHGWFFLAVCYLIAYLWEDPNVWVELFSLGVYAVLMLLTCFMDLSHNCILPFILAGLLTADLVILVITKARK